MALRYGTCTNYGLCKKADTREAQNIVDGTDFVCQDCGRPLAGLGQNTGRAASNRVWPLAVFGMLLVGICGGLAFLMFHRSAPQSSPTAGAMSPLSPGTGTSPVLRLSGSNTIGAELGPALAHAWLTNKGFANVHRERSSGSATLC